MIENKNGANRNLEKALQALEQAKQRAANGVEPYLINCLIDKRVLEDYPNIMIFAIQSAVQAGNICLY